MPEWDNSLPNEEGMYWFYRADEGVQLVTLHRSFNTSLFYDEFHTERDYFWFTNGWWMKIEQPEPPQA